MDPESLSRVFDRFYQTTPAVGSGEGLGLGLTIARHLVQMHGGTLTASSPGREMGTSFVIRLPRAKTSQPSEVKGSKGFDDVQSDRRAR
jgi:signal transduction histidine kinase